MEARLRQVPVAGWGLSRDEWPDTGPRTLRLPPIAMVEVTVREVPAPGFWSRHPLGAKALPSDAPSFAPTHDGAVRTLLAERDAVLPVLVRDALGRLHAPETTLRLPLAAHRTHTLHLRCGNEYRLLRIRPDGTGPLQRVHRWEDLPRAP